MKAAILAAPLLLLATIAQARDISSEIDAANAKWIAAFNKGDAAAVAQLYTERATALPPGAPMAKGRAAIQAFWDGAIKNGVKNVTLKSVQVNQFGNAAREIGEFARCTERSEAMRTNRESMSCCGGMSVAVGSSTPISGTATSKLPSLRCGRQPYHEARSAGRNG